MTFALLSRDDLVALTDQKRRAGIIDWLNAHGWVYETGASGWPKVSVAYAEGKLGGAAAKPGASVPNLEALRALQRKAA